MNRKETMKGNSSSGPSGTPVPTDMGSRIGTEIWVSLADAAELELIEYEVIKKQVQRDGGYGYRVKYEPNPSGGKDLVYIALSSLSEKAQVRYENRIRERLKRERAKKALANKQPPWYTEVDIGWYLSAYKQEYMEKTALCGEIEKYFEQKAQHKKNVTEFCEVFAKEHLGMSGKQMRRYIGRYEEGLEWATLAEEQDGQNYYYYRILALCTPPKAGIHTKLTPEIMALIENLWSQEEFHRNRQSVQMLHERLEERLRADYVERMKDGRYDTSSTASGSPSPQGEGLEELWIPSYKTVKRYVDELEAKYSGAAALMKDGERQWKNTTMQKRLRNTSSLQVMELWQGDAHTFDCWIEVTKPNGTKTAIRPYLVAFVDTRSRCIAAWGICTQPNSEVIKKVIIHGIYPKEGSPVHGVPRILLIDNGKDFTAQTLTGRKRTERFDIDGEIRGFYKALGIEYDMRALPYQAWTKGQIERFFGTLCSGFSKRFASYTGTLTGSRTDAKVKKDIKGMLERGELHTMDEFAVMFEAYLEKYHEKRHGGLERQHEKNPRPRAVYENAERYVKAAPPMEYALSLLGTTIVRTVYATGIELDKHRYMSQELAAYIGEKVTVRVRENDVNTVICYTSDGHLIGKAYRTEMLDPIADKDDDRLIEHIKSQRQQLRSTKDDIAALRTPYEERTISQTDMPSADRRGRRSLQGGDDNVLNEVYPTLSGEDAKVVSFVDDRQYAEELSAKSKKNDSQRRSKKGSKEHQEINDFMRAQADKAFERLRRLG